MVDYPGTFNIKNRNRFTRLDILKSVGIAATGGMGGNRLRAAILQGGKTQIRGIVRAGKEGEGKEEG